MQSKKTNSAPIVQTLSEYMPKPIVDASTEGVVYRGYAPINTGRNFPGWRIERETTTDGITITEYPQGSMEFAFSWDDRKTYEYSR